MQERPYRDHQHILAQQSEHNRKAEALTFQQRYRQIVNEKAELQSYKALSYRQESSGVKERQYLHWKNLYQQISKTNKEDPLHVSLKQVFKKQLWTAYLISNFSIMLHILTAFLLYFIFKDILNHEYKSYQNMLLTGLIILVSITHPFLTNYADNCLHEVGLKMHQLISLAIIRKSLNCSTLSNKNITISEMSKIMHIDCEKLLHYPIKNASVVEGGLYFVLLSTLVVYLAGWPGLIGLICLSLLVSIRYCMKKIVKTRQQQLNTETSRRVQVEIEVFSMIKFIKANALESCYFNKLRKIRMDQVEKLKAKLEIDAINISLTIVTKQIALVIIMKLISLFGGSFNAAITFSINLCFSLINLQSAIKNFSDLEDIKASIKKIENLLDAEEMDSSYLLYEANKRESAIKIKNGNFYWDLDESHKNQDTTSAKFQLKNINVQIKQGDLVSLIGTYGSGKSSFANCLLGQMKSNKNSEVLINGSIAYCSQVPWIMNDTVKNNIKFGKEFNKIKYEEAIVYSSLEDDLLIFKDGDQTLIGEKGSTLSGGQKARISLARALYSDADIYVMDDILSAVDAHVGSFIFNQTIKRYLEAKTVLLITHSLYFVKHTDRILIFDQGRIIQQGTYEQLQYTDLLLEVQSTDLKKKMSKKRDSKIIKQTEPRRHMNIKRQEAQEDQQLKDDEKEVIDNRQALRVYIRRNSGCLFVVTVLTFTLISSFLLSYFRIMLNVWSFSTQQKSDKFIFILLTINTVQALFTYLLSTILYSSKMFQSLHDDMIKGLLFSPYSYFQAVPFDRIVNRLSSQLNNNDKAFTSQFILSQFYAQTIICYITCILFVYGSKNQLLLFGYIILHFSATIYFYQKYLYFDIISNKLQQSLIIPIKSKYSQMLNGLSTVRAYKKIQYILQICFRNLQLFAKASSLRTEIGIKIKYIVAFSINLNILLSLVIVFFIENAIGNLTIFLLFNVFAIEDSIVRFHKTFYQVVARFKSLGRCEQIARLEPEKGYQKYLTANYVEDQGFKKQYFGQEVFPRGEIRFENYCLRYKPELNDVLKSINLVIRPKEKIGIVGRTGSGKSTLMLGLLRILQAFAGKIVIDGIQIASLSLQQLRSSINIILQDHFLFTGTLRDNVDPTHAHSDSQIISALRLCGVWEEFEKREGLSSAVEEGGNNLSSGEKQLINISRSLLNPKRIVLIDEATASIDLETDAQIQKAIRKHFADKTVLTIAHRINTVVDSDRILVLNKGKIAEFDSPQNLLKKQDSLFYQLYKQAGKKKQE